MKPSFLHSEKPILTNMIIARKPQDCVIIAKNAIYDGADAFGLHICQLEEQYRTRESYRQIFGAMGQRPIYITNYRGGFSTGSTDEERMLVLFDALKAGATMADMMGDMFDPSPREITYSPAAIARQKDWISKIHDAGKEVLLSSHVNVFLPAEQVLEIAFAQQERGADIVKIVTGAESTEEEVENLRITALLKKELRVPFLFLSNGTHFKLHRMIGPMLGCCMALCVQCYDELSSKNQPLLSAARRVLDTVDYLPDFPDEEIR